MRRSERGVGADQPGEDDKPLARLVVTTGQRRPTLSEGSSRPPASRRHSSQPRNSRSVSSTVRESPASSALVPVQPAEPGGAWTVADRLVQGGSPPPPTCGSAITPRPPGGPRRPATCSPPPGKPSTPPSGAMWRRTPTSIAAAGRKIGTPRAGRPPTDPGRRPPSPWPAGPSSTASPRTACTGRSRTKTGTDVHSTDGRGWTSGVSTCSGRATASGPGGATQQPRGRAGCPATRAGARAQAHARSRGAAASDPDCACRGAPALRGGGTATCRSDGITAAFDLAADETTLLRPPGRGALTAFEPRHLAIACADAGGTRPRRRPAWPARRSRMCQKRPLAISYLTWTSGRFWIAGRSNDTVAGLAEPVRPLADGPARGTPDPGLGRGQPQRAGRW